MNAAVLARLQSPGFTFVSYRRSGKSAVDAGCDLPALDIAIDGAFTALDADVDCPLSLTGVDHDVASDSTEVEWQEHDCFDLAHGNACACQPPQAGTCDNNAEDDDARVATSMNWCAIASWQFDAHLHQSGVTGKAVHLLVLWRFLSCIPLSLPQMSTDTLDKLIRPHWWRALRAATLPPGISDPQLKDIFGSLLADLCRFSYEDTILKDQGIVQVIVHLVCGAISSGAVQFALESVFAAEDCSIHDRFVALVLELYDILDDLLRVSHPVASASFQGGCRRIISALVDEVLSLVYTHQQFTALRAEISALLMERDAQTMALGYLFRVFVVQAREFKYLRRGAPNDAQPFQRRTDLRILASKWNQRWLLEPSTIQVVNRLWGPERTSLLEFVCWLHEFSCVDMALYDDDHGARLYVRSVVSGAFGATELALDGSLHSLRTTPSGMASAVLTSGGWSVSNYAAVLSDRPNELEIEVYAIMDGGLLFGVHVPVGCLDSDAVRAFTVRRVCVRLVLEERVTTRSFSSDDLDRNIVFHCAVAHATHTGFVGSEYQADSPSHAALFKELCWAPLFEIQGGYVAVASASTLETWVHSKQCGSTLYM
ncbi:unnamed protein product [Phytophthora fragariaefolia]|uniref:Unnamed protein product n=1 Tax=Phytophthora fragariaefolia TaxID=1490495 RepID=A0A9W7CVA9_9STRA|nr:unnamed protein product [Phytophthora fragariaefolia]